MLGKTDTQFLLGPLPKIGTASSSLRRPGGVMIVTGHPDLCLVGKGVWEPGDVLSFPAPLLSGRDSRLLVTAWAGLACLNDRHTISQQV